MRLKKKKIILVEQKKSLSRNHPSMLSTNYDGAFVKSWAEIFAVQWLMIPIVHIGTPSPTGLGNLALYDIDKEGGKK
jgi:hypothetical protein